MTPVPLFSPDDLNRQIQITRPDPDGGGPLSAPVIDYTYDAEGKILTQKDPLGNVTSYEYDNMGRQTTVGKKRGRGSFLN